MEEKIRILVVHGYCMLRGGLVERLNRRSWIDVCAVTTTMNNMSELILQHRPNILLVNVSPKCSSGVESFKKLKKEFGGMKILAFSCSMEFEDLHAGIAINAGADGYVSSADTSRALIDAIRKVNSGGQYMSPQLRRLKRTMPGFSSLSQREAEVFCLVGCGHASRSIAEMMDLKMKTVESYRERIRKKLNLPQGADLLYTAVSFMRSVARQNAGWRDDREMIKELLSAKAA